MRRLNAMQGIMFAVGVGLLILLLGFILGFALWSIFSRLP